MRKERKERQERVMHREGGKEVAMERDETGKARKDKGGYCIGEEGKRWLWRKTRRKDKSEYCQVKHREGGKEVAMGRDEVRKARKGKGGQCQV